MPLASGSVADGGLRGIVQQIQQETAAGKLHLVCDSAEYYLYFQNGVLLYAATHENEDKLARELLGAKVISFEDREHIRKLQLKTKYRFGEAMMMLGTIKQDLLRGFIQERTRATLEKLREVTAGNFTFTENALPGTGILSFPKLTDELATAPVSLTQLLRPAAQAKPTAPPAGAQAGKPQAAPAPRPTAPAAPAGTPSGAGPVRTATAMPSQGDPNASVFVQQADGALARTDVNLNMAQWKMFALAEEPVSISDILRKCGLPPELANKTLGELLRSKMVVRVQKTDTLIIERQIEEATKALITLQAGQYFTRGYFSRLSQHHGDSTLGYFETFLNQYRTQQPLFRDVAINEQGALNAATLYHNLGALAVVSVAEDVAAVMGHYLTSLHRFFDDVVKASLTAEELTTLLDGVTTFLERFLHGDPSYLKVLLGSIQQVRSRTVAASPKVEMAAQAPAAKAGAPASASTPAPPAEPHGTTAGTLVDEDIDSFLEELSGTVTPKPQPQAPTPKPAPTAPPPKSAPATPPPKAGAPATKASATPAFEEEVSDEDQDLLDSFMDIGLDENDEPALFEEEEEDADGLFEDDDSDPSAEGEDDFFSDLHGMMGEEETEAPKPSRPAAPRPSAGVTVNSGSTSGNVQEDFQTGLKYFRKKRYDLAVEHFQEMISSGVDDKEVLRYYHMSKERGGRILREALAPNTPLLLTESALEGLSLTPEEQKLVQLHKVGHTSLDAMYTASRMTENNFYPAFFFLVTAHVFDPGALQAATAMPMVNQMAQMAPGMMAGNPGGSGGPGMSLAAEVESYELDQASLRNLERTISGPITLGLRKFELMDFYQMFGLKRSYTVQQLKKAYKIATKQCTPQIVSQLKNPELKQKARELLKKLTEAYEVLANPDKRREYDAGLRAELEESGKKKREATTYFQEGMNAKGQSRYNEAIEFFEKAIQLAPANPVYHQMLREVRDILKDKRGQTRFKTAQMAIREENWAEAVKHMKAAIEVNANNMDYLKILLETLDHVPDNTDDKIQTWLRIIGIEPTVPEHHLEVAQLYMSKRDYQAAADEYYLADKWADDGNEMAKKQLEEIKKKHNIVPTSVVEMEERRAKIAAWEERQKRKKGK